MPGSYETSAKLKQSNNISQHSAVIPDPVAPTSWH